MSERAPPNFDALAALAIDAARKAWAPYSGFHVGAALLCEDGTIFTGCNVENASYGLTICAERTAVVKAVSEGHRRFLGLAISTDLDTPASPCGMCRQTLAEFGPDLSILLVGQGGSRRLVELSQLLPDAFTPAELLAYRGTGSDP